MLKLTLEKTLNEIMVLSIRSHGFLISTEGSSAKIINAPILFPIRECYLSMGLSGVKVSCLIFSLIA